MYRISRPDISIGRRLRYCIPLNACFIQSHCDPTTSIPILHQKLRVMGLMGGSSATTLTTGAGGLKRPATLTETLTNL